MAHDVDFLIVGSGVAKGRNLGSIDMRQIAPTFARILDVELPAATQPPLDLQRMFHSLLARREARTGARPTAVVDVTLRRE